MSSQEVTNCTVDGCTVTGDLGRIKYIYMYRVEVDAISHAPHVSYNNVHYDEGVL